MEIATTLLSFHTYRGKAEYPTETFINVRHLNEQTKSIPQFVWYYATWCGHCKELKQKWQDLEKICTDLNMAVRFKGVDCERLPHLVNSYVKGYPTLILHKHNQEPIVYKEPREMANLVGFLQKNCKSL